MSFLNKIISLENNVVRTIQLCFELLVNIFSYLSIY